MLGSGSGLWGLWIIDWLRMDKEIPGKEPYYIHLNTECPVGRGRSTSELCGGTSAGPLSSCAQAMPGILFLIGQVAAVVLELGLTALCLVLGLHSVY